MIMGAAAARWRLLRFGSLAGQIRWRYQHGGVTINLKFFVDARLSTVPARTGLATGRGPFVRSGRRQHVRAHYCAISSLGPLYVLGIVQIREGAGRLLSECGQAGQLAQYGLLALV